jgi:hypothetical protein
MSDDEWANVVRFRAELEGSLGRTVTLGEALAISARLNLLYISLGKETRFNFSGKGSELENVNVELGGETLNKFLEEMKRIFGIAEKESKILSDYKEIVSEKNEKVIEKKKTSSSTKMMEEG